jgi:hypothetical protein
LLLPLGFCVETVKEEYRGKIVHDSIFKTDTKAPLISWQSFQVWCGRIALAVLLFVGLLIFNLVVGVSYHFL